MEEVIQFSDGDDFNALDRLLARITAGRKGQAQMLAGFLEACLANLGWPPAELARRLAVDDAIVVGILRGTTPVSDALLIRIASEVGYEPNVLRILLGRPFTPTAEPKIEDEDPDFVEYMAEIEKLHEDMIEQLLIVIDERYAMRRKNRRSQQHDVVVRHLETLIARYRADVKFAEVLVEQLRAPGDTHPQRIDIWRIIHYIRDHVE